jgi:hypothetical protein
LADRLVVSRIEYKHPTLSVVGITIQKGLVIAAGPGKERRRKTRFDGPQGKCLWFEDGELLNKPRHPMPFKVGDCVEFSPRGLIEFDFEGLPLLMVWAKACYGTTNDSASEALLWQTPGGYDKDGKNFMSGADLYI